MKKIPLIFIGLAAIILIALFLVFKPQATEQGAAPRISVPQAYAFTIRDGKKIAGPPIIQVPLNTEIRLVVNADKQDELHVHGYDLAKELPAGETIELIFTAERSGRFGIELHDAHAELTTLQVQPR